MRFKKANIILFALIVVLLFAFFKWRNLEYRKTEPINHNVDSLSFSAKALCNMNCQHLSKEEIGGILKKGIIIYNKTIRSAKACPVYYVRGFN